MKIEIHKLINSIDSYEKYNSVYNELTDRFGRLNDDIIIYILNRDDSWSVNYRDKSRRAECRKLKRR